MTKYELTNIQREFFGLDPIESHWERVLFKGDTYRPESILYFDGDVIKRHIVSTENKYLETHYNELTKNREVLLPKTNKGKEKKLTASVLEQRQPSGLYLSVFSGDLVIGNYNSQTTFYSSRWDKNQHLERTIADSISEFIEQSPKNHLNEIKTFKNSTRKNVKFKSGDYFCFKLDRINFGFGRILLDVNKIRKKGFISDEHGLGLLMGLPVIVQLFAFKSQTKNIDIATLDTKAKLPSDIMMDNWLLYGQFEIIGYREIQNEEFEFPISYGRSIDQRCIVFLQWGLIHMELPQEKFHKYVTGEKEFDQNPYGYYSIGFSPHYDTIDVLRSCENKGIFEYNNSDHYKAKWDLRNPKNDEVKKELFKVFGLLSNKSYIENCKLTGTILTSELIKQL
ncbi:MAG: immunity 26/phosphotriesterase HocA family protein [Bacteroidota bacterium]